MSARTSTVLLWLAAVVLMLGSATYQRLTGPTQKLRGTVEGAAGPVRYRLIRSEETVRPARVNLPDLGPGATATVSFRRYPTEDPFTEVEMVTEAVDGGTELAAYLPAQAAAGKLEYWVDIDAGGQVQRIPSEADALAGEETIVMRFKDPVPLPLLLSHVAMMFFAVLIGMRAGLGALFAPRKVQGLSWFALGLMTVGGMILGPFVQNYAFGAYWTGFPWGYDLTDNKTLIMWLAWIIACAVLGWRRKEDTSGTARAVVVAASIVMTVVYLIPHSLRGSELDYEQVDSGVPSTEAVGTGN
jgi:hypothetical protein